jgi:succinate--hydroxymethylglutarate CoA-transferase
MTNFVPSQVEKLMLDYESIKKANQKIIYASVQGFPLDSAWKNKAAFDLTIQAMSGLMHCTGDPEGSPFKVGYAVTDILTGMTLLQGILGAVIHRERTGEGKHYR